MTRKEEIEQKAKIRADQYSHPVEWNDCYHHWIEGAEWADKTMIDHVCKYLYRKFENGKVLSSQLIDDLRKAMEE